MKLSKMSWLFLWFKAITEEIFIKKVKSQALTPWLSGVKLLKCKLLCTIDNNANKNHSTNDNSNCCETHYKSFNFSVLSCKDFANNAKITNNKIVRTIPIQKAALIFSEEYKLPTPPPTAKIHATTKPIYNLVVLILSFAKSNWLTKFPFWLLYMKKLYQNIVLKVKKIKMHCRWPSQKARSLKIKTIVIVLEHSVEPHWLDSLHKILIGLGCYILRSLQILEQSQHHGFVIRLILRLRLLQRCF